MQWSGIGGFGGGLGELSALGGLGFGAISPFHMVQLRERPQPCVVERADNLYWSKYSSRDQLEAFDGVNDNILFNFFYPVCTQSHVGEVPIIDANGVPLFFEIPLFGQAAIDARNFDGNPARQGRRPQRRQGGERRQEGNRRNEGRRNRGD
jgi:hypothetical protein